MMDEIEAYLNYLSQARKQRKTQMARAKKKAQQAWLAYEVAG